MKKFKNFPVINSKNVITFVSMGIILVSIVFSQIHLFYSNLSPDFISFLVHTGTKKPYDFPDINITRSMISLCVPTIRFSDKEKTVPTAKPVAALKETVTLTPVPENDAMSITYEDAEEKGYKSVEGIYLNNQTSKQIDVSSLLNKSIDLSLSDEPTVLIVHTHTTESYTPSQKYNYTPSETDRTQDSNYNMVAVGKVIYDHLKDNGINVIHDTTVNDYPSYSQSYSKSLKLVESYTKKYPSIKFVIDVHRDAIVTKDGSKMRPVTNFDSTAAQVMLVVGTNDSGLTHPDWQTNLSFAVKLQYKMNSLYPTLARPINLRRERFNQHTAPFAFILEVGTNGNTLDEAKKGALLFSESLVSLLKN